MSSLLIIDDEPATLRNLQMYFEKAGYSVMTASSGREGVELNRRSPADLLLLDLNLGDLHGLDVLKIVKRDNPDTGVVIITGYGDVETAVEAMLLNADQFVLKPLNLKVLETMIAKILENRSTRDQVAYFKKKLSASHAAEEGRAADYRLPSQIHHAVRLLADNPDTSVLILGDTGTGKGLVSQLIHQLSPRAAQPFIDINCAALNNELVESELFGYEQGAFTDARNAKKGLLQVAHRGSLFLDEVAELSPSVQAKLLKVLEDRTFRRLGGTTNIAVDVRIMCATNANIEQAVEEGRFRRDLYYRLNVMPVVLPPLVQRREDIIPLARDFVQEYSRNLSRKVGAISPQAEQLLLSYRWPGNIRELRNVIERAVLLCQEDEIGIQHLPASLTSPRQTPAPVSGSGPLSLEEVERQHIESVLTSCNFNRSHAAEILGIHRTTLIKKMKKYQLDA